MYIISIYFSASFWCIHVHIKAISYQQDISVIWMSHILRKPVFWVGDQLRLKPACYPTKTSSDLESLVVLHIFAWFSNVLQQKRVILVLNRPPEYTWTSKYLLLLSFALNWKPLVISAQEMYVTIVKYTVAFCLVISLFKVIFYLKAFWVLRQNFRCMCSHERKRESIVDSFTFLKRKKRYVRTNKQVAQWATIAHHGASIMFGDTIKYDAQRKITLNLKQWPGINSKT